MEYVKTEKYDIDIINQKIMGPNPLKLEEELMRDNRIKTGAIVMDLGSGQGITSVFLAKELLLSWTPEQLDYIHDIEYWKNIVSKSKNSEMVSISQMESNEECWNDWIQCDNEYSINDRKAIEAGACKYLNFIAIVLKKK